MPSFKHQKDKMSKKEKKRKKKKLAATFLYELKIVLSSIFHVEYAVCKKCYLLFGLSPCSCMVYYVNT